MVLNGFDSFGRCRKVSEGVGRCWKVLERFWNGFEGVGRILKVLEGL